MELGIQGRKAIVCASSRGLGRACATSLAREGVAVVINPAKSQLLRSAGEFYWGGMASTAFWIDPQEEIVAVFFTQLVPSGSTPIRPELRIAVNQAIIDEAPPAYAPSVGSVAHRL